MKKTDPWLRVFESSRDTHNLKHSGSSSQSFVNRKSWVISRNLAVLYQCLLPIHFRTLLWPSLCNLLFPSNVLWWYNNSFLGGEGTGSSSSLRSSCIFSGNTFGNQDFFSLVIPAFLRSLFSFSCCFCVWKWDICPWCNELGMHFCRALSNSLFLMLL